MFVIQEKKLMTSIQQNLFTRKKYRVYHDIYRGCLELASSTWSRGVSKIHWKCNGKMLHHVWEQMGRVKIIWNFVKIRILPSLKLPKPLKTDCWKMKSPFRMVYFQGLYEFLGSVLLVELLVIPKFLNSWDSFRIWNAQFGPMGNWQHRGWINQHISSHGFPTHHIIESSAVNTNITSSSEECQKRKIRKTLSSFGQNL